MGKQASERTAGGDRQTERERGSSRNIYANTKAKTMPLTMNTTRANRAAKKSSRRVPHGRQSLKVSANKWKGLDEDISDDQQDIARGRGMVDALFQGPQGGTMGTQNAVMQSYDYISQGLKDMSSMDNMYDDLYISPSFMDKVVVHLAKNFMELPKIKIPLILGVWGGKGQGKTFQSDLIFRKLGISPIVMSAGELESGNAGEPAKLIRQRYREFPTSSRRARCAAFSSTTST